MFKHYSIYTVSFSWATAKIVICIEHLRAFLSATIWVNLFRDAKLKLNLGVNEKISILEFIFVSKLSFLSIYAKIKSKLKQIMLT